jgi:hypothetical protein
MLTDTDDGIPDNEIETEYVSATISKLVTALLDVPQ